MRQRTRLPLVARTFYFRLVTLMQFRENLSDRQAADAVRSRIDWKYLLGLELTDSGFDFSVLSDTKSGCQAPLIIKKQQPRFRDA